MYSFSRSCSVIYQWSGRQWQVYGGRQGDNRIFERLSKLSSVHSIWKSPFEFEWKTDAGFNVSFVSIVRCEQYCRSTSLLLLISKHHFWTLVLCCKETDYREWNHPTFKPATVENCVCCAALSPTRLFAIGSQLSPEVGSSGIEMLETDAFKLHCFQTLTGISYFKLCGDIWTLNIWTQVTWTLQIFLLLGIKFIVLADPRQSGIDALLRKIYEIYSDFALKNPFYSLEMPIR